MRENIRNNWDRVRYGSIVLVVCLMLGCMLASCAAQEAPEAESTQKETTQPKTADDYVNDGDFSTPCPASGATAGAVWFDNGYQVQAIDGTLAATDTLVVEAGVTVKATSPNTGWSVLFAVVLLDENGEYLCSFFDMKDGPTGSRDMSFICQEYSTLVVGNYGEPAEYELYVVRADFADGDSWGFADKDIGAVSSTDTGYEALKVAGEFIGEGSIQHSGNASGNVGAGNNTSSSNSSLDRYKQNVSDVSTDSNDCIGTWSAKTNDGTEYFTLEPLSEETGQGAVSWEQVTSHITQSRSGVWEWDDVGFVADGNTYHARITLDDYSFYADALTDGISLNLFIPGVDEHIWSRVHEE